MLPAAAWSYRGAAGLRWMLIPASGRPSRCDMPAPDSVMVVLPSLSRPKLHKRGRHTGLVGQPKVEGIRQRPECKAFMGPGQSRPRMPPHYLQAAKKPWLLLGASRPTSTMPITSSCSR